MYVSPKNSQATEAVKWKCEYMPPYICQILQWSHKTVLAIVFLFSVNHAYIIDACSSAKRLNYNMNTFFGNSGDTLLIA